MVVFAFHVGLDYYVTLDYSQKGDVESRVLNILRLSFYSACELSQGYGLRSYCSAWL